MLRSAVMSKHLVPIVLICAVFSIGCGHNRPPRGVTAIERSLVVTGYCRCGECCGWRRNWFGRPVYTYGPQKGEKKRVGVTASATSAHVGTIAADASRYPFGTIMYVEGYGYGRVEDRGQAIVGEHIDLFFLTHRQALAWGKKNMIVKVWPVR